MCGAYENRALELETVRARTVVVRATSKKNGLRASDDDSMGRENNEEKIHRSNFDGEKEMFKERHHHAKARPADRLLRTVLVRCVNTGKLDAEIGKWVERGRGKEG
ncbi:hypothetical protein MTO96_003335 [Rhipicephalus appendiculatus]